MSTQSLERTKNSKYAIRILALNLVTIAPTFQYGLSVMNPMVGVIKEMYNDTYYERTGEVMTQSVWQTLESLTMSIVLGGAFFGALLFSVLLKLFSRKNSMLVIHSINIIGITISAIGGGLSSDWEVLIVGRFVTGVALGLGISILPLFNGELSTIDEVAFYQGFIGVGLAVGNFLGVLFGWSYILGRTSLWAIAVAIPMLPSFIYLCLATWLCETPYYTIKHCGVEETMKLLCKLRVGSEISVKRELNSFLGASQLHEADTKTNGNSVKGADVEESTLLDEVAVSSNNKSIGIVQAMKVKVYRRQFIGVCILYMGIMFSGLMDILLYSTTIFLNAGIPEDMTATATVCVFFLQVLAAIPGHFILHKVGSWMLCLVGLVIIVVSHVILTISLAVGLSYLSIFAMILYFIGFSGGLNIAVFAVITEITTERTRSICVGVGGSLLWFTGWLTGFIASYLKTWIGAYSPLVWATLSGLVILYLVLCVPNTKSKTQEQIQEFFKK